MDTNSQPYERQALHNVLKNIIEEAKMILPGTQTLFGFQLIVVFSDYFQNTFTDTDRLIYFIAMFLTLFSFAIIISLIAYHRRAPIDLVTISFVKLGSQILKAGMVPLLVAISMDFYLVAFHTFQNRTLALSSGIVTFLALTSLWYILPRLGAKRLNEE